MRIGLTGGIAAGKSTVAALLREHGYLVIDGDELAREVVQRGTPGLAAIVAEFGPAVLTDVGDLDRSAMATWVFSDEAARRRLEAIVHPLIHRRAEELIEAAGPHADVVQDQPLLVEMGLAGEFDEVIVVDVPESIQIERMIQDRGWTREQAEARMGAQATRAQRLEAATRVLDNTGSYEQLRHQVDSLVAQLRERGSGS